MKKHICPVCDCDCLIDEPYNENGDGSYEICPCCGFQFGYDDFPNKEEQIKLWRINWIKNERKWFSSVRKPKI